jgi:hydroxypyruvate reductase
MLRYQDYRQHVEQLMSAAISAADPTEAVGRFLARVGTVLHIGDLTYDLEQGHVYLVSVGKAAAAMADSAIQILGNDLHSAAVISKKGSETATRFAGRHQPALILLEGNHPVSGAESVRATQAVIHMLAQTGVNDLVLCLISGGTSALLTLPIISLSDWQSLTNALLASGCTINEMNTVRRQLDRVKGGGLAQMAAPAHCMSLILSDVIGNPLQAIGSGPTLFVDETAVDAITILKRYAIMEYLDTDVWERIISALEQPPRAAQLAEQHNDHIIVGDVRQSATSVLAKAMQLGFIAQVLTARLEGEAREVARVAAAIAKDMPLGRCLILGGETTVKLNADGLGGRNLELALAAAIALDGWSDIVLASFTTDGEDGPTSAAGAVVSGDTVEYGRHLGLDPVAFLDRNDSFHFFQHLDESFRQVDVADGSEQYLPITLLTPGPTGTNVNDLLIILTYPHDGSYTEL